MSTLKVAGFLTLVAGIASLAFVPRLLDSGPGGAPVSAIALGAVGLFLSVLGLVFLMKSPSRPEPMAPPPEPAAPVENIEIKRTQMDWGGNVAEPADAQEPAPGDARAQALDDVRRRMGKLKVDFGLGKLSANAYHELMKELEAEEAALLKAGTAEGAA